MNCCNVYEKDTIAKVLGETLRPGGYDLTEKAIEYCNLSPKNKILDLGCGLGATIGYLLEKHNINAIGIDPSEKLLNMAKERYKLSDFFLGRGENLPFPDEIFDCIFAECTLSLMEDLDSVFKEVYRVLKKDSVFVISDIYANNPEYVEVLHNMPINCSLKGMHDINKLQENLSKKGFIIEYFEDYSYFLKSLLAQIVFSFGNMESFWSEVMGSYNDVYSFQKTIKACKPGYFFMIAKKGD